MRRGGGERGFALLIVLWTVVFLSFLLTEIMASGRQAVALAANLRMAAAARAADDGAINTAVLHLLTGGASHWRADGAPHEVATGGTQVVLRIDDLAGMVNPNLASAGLLAGLLQAVGEPAAQAGDLADAIIVWRSPPDSPAAGAAALSAYREAGAAYGPPAQPFAATAELIYVSGMTPDLLARLTPHLSLFQTGDPDPQAADPVVRKAMLLGAAANPGGSNYKGMPVVAITACAAAPAGLCRRAVVSLALGGTSSFQLLALDTSR